MYIFSGMQDEYEAWKSFARMRIVRRVARYLAALLSISSLYFVALMYEANPPSDQEENFVHQSSMSIRHLVMATESLASAPFQGNIFTSDTIPENQLLDLNNFNFIKNCSHVCQKDDPYIVAFVHSAPGNFVKRKVIRDTWASPKICSQLNLKVIFILGLTNDSIAAKRIDREYYKYSDIVQGRFIDSYKNLTYKHLTGFKWITKFCNKTKFVMKSDDDAFIDIFKVVSTLKDMFDLQPDHVPSGILACSLFPDGTSAKREGKWALTLSEYPNKTYPSYCSGIAYFISPDVLVKLHIEANTKFSKNFLWIDDLFVTGILAMSIRQNHQPLNFKFMYEPRRFRNWLDQKEVKSQPYLVGDIGDVSDWRALMLKLWEKTKRAYF